MEHGDDLELSKTRPKATIYQNASDVIIVYSAVKDLGNELFYRGTSSSFENNWSDGGACGFDIGNKKELNKYIKQNNLVRRGTVTLGLYCWSKNTLKDGATLTCELRPNHKGKHQAYYSSDFGRKTTIRKWSD